MKKPGKKLLGILLTASIAAAAVFPVQGTAAEGIDREMKSEAQKEEADVAQGEMSDTVSANVPPAGEVGDNSIMLMSYDINQPVIESFELEEKGQALTKDDILHFNMSAYDADGDISSVTVQISRRSGYSNTQTVTLKNSEGNLYKGTFPCSSLINYEGDYYVSKIRLEDRANNYVEMPVMADGEPLYTFTVSHSKKVTVSDFQMKINASNADGNLRVGDTVTYTAHVECEGTELTSSTRMYLRVPGNNILSSESVSTSYNAETRTLTGTYTVKNTTYPAEWKLDSIYIMAKGISFYAYPAQMEPDKDLKFTVVNDDYDTEKPVIKSITVDKNGQMVKAGESVTVKVKVEEKNPSSSMSVRFSPETSGSSALSATLWLNQSTMEYTGSISITHDTYPTKWELTYLYVSDANGNKTFLTDFQKDENANQSWYFTVDPEGYIDDKEAPVIESITIDKNGQWVQPGDAVTITVKVDEENPSPTAYAYFYPQVSYVSGYNIIYLNYNADTGEYVGSLPITANTYPCEWMLTDLTVYDIKGHYTYLSNFKPDWQTTCPWYYRVKNDDTYREDVKDVSFSFYGLVPQEYGGYVYGYLMENETIKVGRRGSLKELGIWPSLPAEGVSVKCQEGWSGQEIDGDTELFFGDTPRASYDFYATYDKSCVNVVLTYLSRDDGAKMAVVPQFVDKEATYGEMLDSFVLPEDADTSFLSGFEMDVDQTAQVEDTAYVGVEAKYSDCLVAWHIQYPDENGNKITKIVSKTYKKGTTINEAILSLEEPEGPEGLEFEKWTLSGIDGKEPLIRDMTNTDLIAVYKGKTTADISYTYRGEDGKLVSGNKLVLLDGEGLSYAAVREEVPEILKGINHFKDLILSDWTGVSGNIDISRYKKVNVRAQYDNCVVILKYPNNVYEYVVVDKGSRFTLPVESKKYKDILWEGYKKGETVTITEDREFLTAEVKLKDGMTEGPSGEKLSGEEIDKIIADIEQSGSGETIHVDMRKVTIVPKEVLEAIQGKEVNIVLDMGNYSWSIGGNDVVATDLKDIDLEVIVDTDTIPPSIVDSLAEGKPATQITLIHDGEFGFRADLTLNLGSQHSGSKGNLYYYDSAGKLIFRDAGEIGADGNISLSFSHASEYVVIIEKASLESGNKNDIFDGGQDSGGQNGDGQDSSGQEEISIAKMEGNTAPGTDAKKNNDSSKPKSPKTGE